MLFSLFLRTSWKVCLPFFPWEIILMSKTVSLKHDRSLCSKHCSFSPVNNCRKQTFTDEQAAARTVACPRQVSSAALSKHLLVDSLDPLVISSLHYLFKKGTWHQQIFQTLSLPFASIVTFPMPEMRPAIPQMSMDLHHPLQVSRDIPTFSVSTQHQSEVKISGSWVSNRTVSVGHTAQLLHLRGKGWRLFANDAEVEGWLVKHRSSHRTNGNATEVPFNCIYGKIV